MLGTSTLFIAFKNKLIESYINWEKSLIVNMTAISLARNCVENLLKALIVDEPKFNVTQFDTDTFNRLKDAGCFTKKEKPPFGAGISFSLIRNNTTLLNSKNLIPCFEKIIKDGKDDTHNTKVFSDTDVTDIKEKLEKIIDWFFTGYLNEPDWCKTYIEDRIKNIPPHVMAMQIAEYLINYLKEVKENADEIEDAKRIITNTENILLKLSDIADDIVTRTTNKAELIVNRSENRIIDTINNIELPYSKPNIKLGIGINDGVSEDNIIFITYVIPKIDIEKHLFVPFTYAVFNRGKSTVDNLELYVEYPNALHPGKNAGAKTELHSNIIEELECKEITDVAGRKLHRLGFRLGKIDPEGGMHINDVLCLKDATEFTDTASVRTKDELKVNLNYTVDFNYVIKFSIIKNKNVLLHRKVELNVIYNTESFVKNVLDKWQNHLQKNLSKYYKVHPNNEIGILIYYSETNNLKPDKYFANCYRIDDYICKYYKSNILDTRIGMKEKKQNSILSAILSWIVPDRPK